MEWHEKTQYERIVEKWEEKDMVYARLKTARETICTYFRPDLGIDIDEANDMLMLGGDITEGSGPWVARRASTSFQGHTVSKKLDWLKYDFSDNRLIGIDALDIFAQNMKDHVSSVHQRGNFYDHQPQFTLDGWTTGSPLYFIEEDPDTNFVMSIPIHWLTYRIFYNKFNRSEGVIIKDKEWPAKKCFDKFCPGVDIEERLKKAEKIFSQALYNAVINGQNDERFTIYRAVFKVNDPIWNGDNFKQPKEREWYDVYFEETGLKERQDEPLLAEGYFSKPYVHWDYDKKPWETSSRTPAFEAIYDNVSMNQLFKNYLGDMQLKARPAMAVLMGMEDRIDFSSEGIVYVNQGEWNYIPKPIEQVGDVVLETETVKMFRENLSRWFHLDVFQTFTDLAQQTNQDFRVLQLIEIAGEKVTVLIPTMESHEHYLSQVDERVRDIEFRAGRGPFNRLELENIFDILDFYLGDDARGVKIQPEFIGTLRQTQQMQQKLKPLQLGIGALSEFGKSMEDPDFVRNMIKPYEVGDAILQAVNFQQKLVRQKEDFDESVASIAESRARQRQFENQVDMAKALKGSGVIEQLTGQTA